MIDRVLRASKLTKILGKTDIEDGFARKALA